MIDPVTVHLWTWRALYLVLCAAVVFAHILPLQTAGFRLPAPDILMALTCAWVLRRPDHIPALSVAVVFFMADLMFMQPPGLATAIVLVASEFLRSRSPFVREFPFALEWGVVAVVILAAVFAARIALLVLGLTPPDFILTLVRAGATIALYPLVVLVCHFGLRVRFILPGERERPGLGPQGAR